MIVIKGATWPTTAGQAMSVWMWNISVNAWSIARWWGVQLALITLSCCSHILTHCHCLFLTLSYSVVTGDIVGLLQWVAECFCRPTLHRPRVHCCCNWLYCPPSASSPSSPHAVSVHSSRHCVAEVTTDTQCPRHSGANLAIRVIAISLVIANNQRSDRDQKLIEASRRLVFVHLKCGVMVGLCCV